MEDGVSLRRSDQSQGRVLSNDVVKLLVVHVERLRSERLLGYPRPKKHLFGSVMSIYGYGYMTRGSGVMVIVRMRGKYGRVVGLRRRWHIIQDVEGLLVDDLGRGRQLGSQGTP